MTYKLKRNADFRFLFNKGQRGRMGGLTVVYHRSRGLRVGFSVSKKHGKSVVRNRIKRLLRASFTSLKGRIKPCYSMIFIPSVRERYDYATMVRDMEKLLIKEGLLSCSEKS